MIPAPAFANPEGGVVTGGSAVITENGSTLTVDQTSSRAVIDWRKFDIAPGETTRFNQPSSTSIALNRVRDSDPSYILGTLSANGNVVLVNPNGVFFGAGAVVDVGGLVATTADIRNDDFMAGRYNFDIPGRPDARIVNRGVITAHEAGLVGLVAPHVENSGVIAARLGKVSLASGDTFTLDMYGDNLISVALSGDVAQQVVSNTGTIEAAGGTITMTAAAGRSVVNSLITVAGELKAPVAQARNGKIVIGAAGSNGTGKSGKSKVLVSGRIDASGKGHGEKGGTVQITGDQVGLVGQAGIDASGAMGGGTVLIGGDYMGGNGVQTAAQAYFDYSARVDVSATLDGDGGKAILWSDINTQFYGNIDARGAGAGDGGFVETSGKQTLTSMGRVHANAQGTGKGGTWLLDPNNITIRNDAGGAPDDTSALDPDGPDFDSAGDTSIVTTEAIEAVLNAGTNVTVTTQSNGANSQTGNVTIYDNINKSSGAASTLTIRSHNDIVLDGGSITRSNGSVLNVDLYANYDLSGAGDVILRNGASIIQPDGSLRIFADAFSVDGTSAIDVNAFGITNSLTSRTISVGTGTSTLQVTDAALARVTARNYTFGSEDSSDVIINTVTDFGDANVSFLSGRDILFNGTLTKASGTGTAHWRLQADRNILNSNDSGIVASTGRIDLIVNADFDAVANEGGRIRWTGGTIATGGGSMLFGGGADPATPPAPRPTAASA